MRHWLRMTSAALAAPTLCLAVGLALTFGAVRVASDATVGSRREQVERSLDRAVAVAAPRLSEIAPPGTTLTASEERFLRSVLAQLDAGPDTWLELRHDGRSVVANGGAGLGPVHEVPLANAGGWSVAAFVPSTFFADPLPVALAASGTTATLLIAGGTGFWVLQTRRRRAVKDHLAQTYHDSRYDALTGIANRAHLMEWLADQLLRCRQTDRPLGLIFIDVDRFKTVNDTMGHAVGDELLKEVARRLSGSVRSGDLVARLAGDEFVVAFPGVGSAEKLAELAERMQHMFEAPVDLGTGPFYASLSMGLALTDGATVDVATLLEQADAAMYVAKNTPGSQYAFFDETLRAEADTRQATGEALRAGLAAGELALHYQPIVAMPERRVVAVEAFVRWNRPGHGVLTPGSFLDVAEETGLIGAIGRLVVTEACRQAARWALRADLADLPIAVNVSERQLLAPDFVAVVSGALRDTGVPAHRLQIEVHEALADDKRVRTSGVLDGLARLGVALVIDDFGFRSGSLGILKELPLAMVKIHGSAVTDVAGSHADQALVEAVSTVASVQHAVTVAEHVETVEQLSTLLALGVNHVQGHLLAPPMGAEELGARIQGRCLLVEPLAHRLAS